MRLTAHEAHRRPRELGTEHDTLRADRLLLSRHVSGTHPSNLGGFRAHQCASPKKQGLDLVVKALREEGPRKLGREHETVRAD